MKEFVLFIFPSGIAMLIDNILSKKENNGIKNFWKFLTYITIINFLNCLIFCLMNSNGDISFSYNIDQIIFITKYLFLSIVLSIILPLLYCKILKNLKISIKMKVKK